MLLLAVGLSAVFAADRAAALDVTEYDVPGTNPLGIASGPDGALWFTAPTTNKIGRITTGGSVSYSSSIPTGSSLPYYIITGPDGNLWFTEYSAKKIGRLTTGGTFAEFNAPGALTPLFLTNGPDGAIWYGTEFGNTIARITTAGVITNEYTSPSAGIVVGITAGPDGALWYAKYNFGTGDKIGRITTAGGITEYDLPDGVGPEGIAAGPDGALWFTEYLANKIGRITTAGAISHFDTPTAGQPYRITLGPDGALWFTYVGAAKIGRITTAGVVTEYDIPSGNKAFDITAGPDGALWFTENDGNKIGRIQPAAGPSTTLVGSSQHPSESGQSVTFTAWVAGAGAELQPALQDKAHARHPARTRSFGTPTGDVGFSSSLDGGLGSATVGPFGAGHTVAAGTSHVCALTSAGGVQCWGLNGTGQLGRGSTGGTATSPADVSGLTSGVVALASGGTHSCALTSSGGVKCWGENGAGQLGNNSNTDSNVPVDVLASAGGSALSGIVGLTAGADHTCALTNAGGVKCWGANSNGELGNSTNTSSSVPVDVLASAGGSALTGIVTVSAGADHACVVTSAGAVKCWGRNTWGQLGNNTTTTSLVPVDVTGLTSGVVTVTTGGGAVSAHSCAVTSAGAVKCWGFNGNGQLGNNSTTNSSIPVDVSGLSSGMAAVFAGNLHTCAVSAAGAAKCWGENGNGGLGDGTTTDRLTPVDVNGLAAGVNSMTAGDRDTCAAMTSSAVKCWGRNISGQLGIGTTTQATVPTDVPGFAGFGIVKAAISTAALSTGTHTITASYPAIQDNIAASPRRHLTTSPRGDAGNSASLGTVTQTVNPPPTLVVSPSTDMSSSGVQGGPFSPGSFQYDLSSQNGAVSFSISGVPSWLDVSTASGTATPTRMSWSRAGGATIRVADASAVTFTVNSAANSLTPATYGPVTINFTNTTNGQGSTTRTATLVVSALGAPTATTASLLTDNSFTANWGSVSGATGYRLDVATDNAFSSFVSGYNDLDVGNATSQAVSGLVANATYYYRVRAANGGFASTSSNTIQVTTGDVPPAPTATAATDITGTSFTANWTAGSVEVRARRAAPVRQPSSCEQQPPGTSRVLRAISCGTGGYRLDVATDNAFSNFVSGYNDAGTATSQSVTGLDPGTTYYYRVRAYDAGGTSGNSNTIQVGTITPTLIVTPGTNINPWTKVGGSFNPSSFQMQVSVSNDTAAYTITGVPSWLDVSLPSVATTGRGPSAPPPLGGTATTTPTTETFTVNGTASSAAVGTLEATITFTNTTYGAGTQTRRATLAVVTLPATHDYNNDGKADILWRNFGSAGKPGVVVNPGTTALWLMNSTAIASSGYLGDVATAWSIVGQRDFDADGRRDVLWRHTNGDVAIWFMNGTSLSGTLLGNVSIAWTVAGTAVFKDDGRGGILWRHDNGDVAIWLMNGQTITATAVRGNVPTSWTIAGTGDFNGDGKADILWRHANGDIAIWFMDGTTMLSSAIVGNVAPPAGWTIVGTGDFDGNGKYDILWRNTNGNVAVWLMNGATIASSAIPGNVPTSWSVVETGDFNADGNADILWRNTNGNIAMWFMNGTALTSGVIIGNVTTDWTIQSAGAN